jgi:hypothetical protein
MRRGREPLCNHIFSLSSALPRIAGFDQLWRRKITQTHFLVTLKSHNGFIDLR